MIYVFRHQEGSLHTNCLSQIGIDHAYDISNKIKQYSSLYVYTCLPKHNGKHVRPIQTASLICSKLKTSLMFIEDYNKFPSNKDEHIHVIIWHHNDIPKILNKYFPDNSFIWDNENYSGCLQINKDEWTFYSNFIETRSFRLKMFKHKFNKIIKYFTYMLTTQ